MFRLRRGNGSPVWRPNQIRLPTVVFGRSARTSRPTWNPDPLRDGYVVAAIVWCLAIALGAIPGAADARGWWASPFPDVYVNHDYSTGYGFYFSPPAALVFFPLTLLPWSAFAALWTGVMFACLLWLTGRWSFAWLLFPPVWWEISSANIALPLAVVAVAGIRHPGLWAFAFLTKVTPGIGVLWFAIRREWRSLSIACALTAAVALPTIVLVPGIWLEWLDLLRTNAGQSGPGYFTIDIPLGARLAAGAALIAWGAATDRRWTVPIAVTLATPVLWFNALATLVGVARARAQPGRDQPLGSAVHPQ